MTARKVGEWKQKEGAGRERMGAGVRDKGVRWVDEGHPRHAGRTATTRPALTHQQQATKREIIVCRTVPIDDVVFCVFVVFRWFCWRMGHTKTLAARGLEEHVRITLIFSRIISFMSFTVLLSHMYFFRRISDHNSHRRFMILKNN